MAIAQSSPTHLDDTLATVGTRVVTGRDLIERIELMPWAGKENVGEADSIKIRALRSLVAEQILALEAAGQDMGNGIAMRTMRSNLEKLLVRDELYRREVMAKVPPAHPAEIRQGLDRFRWRMTVLMLNARSKNNAEMISSALRAGANVDSLVRTTFTGSRPMVIDTARVTFGLLEAGQEDTVYGLTPEHRISLPIEVPRLGWVVLYLLQRENDPEFIRRSVDERTQAVTEKIKRRKEAALANRYSAKVLAAQRAEAKQESFDLLATTLRSIFAHDSVLFHTSAGYRLDMVADSAEILLVPHLNDLLVDAGKTPLTVRDILEGWKYFDIALPSLKQSDFRRYLNAAVKEVVAREYLSREGYRQQLDRSQSVRHDVDTWTNARLAGSRVHGLTGNLSVNDDEVLAYLIAHPDLGQHYEVNIREVLSDSLGQALGILERALHGENIGMLARTYSMRRGWKERDGESGYFPVSRLPEIGFRALQDSVGTIDGPVKTKGGYSVFALLGKRQVHGDSTMTFDSLRTLVRENLLMEKKQSRVDEYVASVAKKYGVTFYYDRLKPIDIFPHNMVTRRFLGFGGSMLAVPALYPAWEWVERAEGVKEVLP